jgi:hypothetical protein
MLTRSSRNALIVAVAAASGLWIAAPARAQSAVLFDFENAPVYSPFPINVAAGGIIAHLSGTGAGYSIQSTTTAPVVPAGFSGHFIYPSSVFGADLLVSFSVPLRSFSILYATQELSCDDSATVRVTAYMDTTSVGTATANSTNLCPCTYTANTLAITTAQPFNNVVVHYDQRPATCQDFGVILLADNMSVTPASAPPPCYPNCDNSTTPPVLNVLDFSCFLNRFAAGDTYANCDNSTTPPVLNVLDFSCFLNAFAAGCS